MPTSVSATTPEQLSELVAERMGLHFPKERWHDLEHGILSAARDFGFNDLELFRQQLLSSSLSRRQIEILASHLTVGETYFFRDEKTFQALEQDILPDLIYQRRGGDRYLRIWSAGCATAEEPYSIAILLSKILPDLNDWNITILATDINPRALKKAMSGIYNDWSFRDCPQSVRERHFRKTKDGRYEILPDIKRMVTFCYHNLAEDPYPSVLNGTNAMDVILCCNVLMYLVPEKARKVVQGHFHCLTDGGWLIVNPSEVSLIKHPQLAANNRHTGINLYRKNSHKDEAKVNLPLTKDVSRLPLTPAPVSVKSVGLQQRVAEVVTSEEPAEYEEALVLYEEGHYPEAEKVTIGVLSRNQANPEAAALLARIYANLGKLPQALVWCQNAITVDKLNPGSHYLLATILQERGQPKEAMVSLKHALFLDPDFVPAYFALGMLAQHEGKLKESRKHFENALLLLNKYRQEDVLGETGITAGRLTEIIRSMLDAEELHETN